MAALEDTKLTRVECINDALDMLSWLGERRQFLAVDVETSGLNVGRDKIRLAQFGDGTRGWALDYGDWRGVVREAINRYDRPIVAHNLLYDSKMLKADGIVIPQRLAHCSMVMAHLKDPSFRMDLKGSAARYVDPRANAGRGLLEQAMAGGGWDWGTVPTDMPAYWQYGVLDTCLTSLLAEKLYPETGGGQFREAYELELAVIHCLREAELAGLLIDQDYRKRAEAKLRDELAVLEEQIPCKPSSDRQVVAYLQSLGAPLFVLTEAGNLSVDKSVLTWLEPTYPVAGLIRDHRSKSRQLTAYLEKFGELAVDDVLHASTRPVAAKTGRMSVTDPPLQTLPRGRVVRDAIIARPGHRLLLADFAGMEMRALASDANEEAMLAAYARGEDLHNFVAAACYGEGFTKQQRQVCKNAAFAKIYGAGVEKFAVTAGISVEDARAFLERYDTLFPGVNRYQQQMIDGVMREAGSRRGRGYVTLIDGRQLPVYGDKAYVATNYRIQGSTCVAMKRKIVELDAAGMGPFFRLAVHDELKFEVPDEHVPVARQVIARVMPDRYSFPNVVLEIEQDEVHRWGDHYRGDYPVFVETEDPAWVANER